MARRAGLSEYLGGKGRYGDTMVAHINPEEAALLKARGGAGTRNPRTGLLEFYYGTFDGGALEDDIFGSTPESAYTYADPNAAPGGGNYDPNIAAEQKAATYPDAIRPIVNTQMRNIPQQYWRVKGKKELEWEQVLSREAERQAARKADIEWRYSYLPLLKDVRAIRAREEELELKDKLSRQADDRQMAISAGYIRPDGIADLRAYFKDIADKEDEATAAATAKYWKDNPEGKWEKIGNVRSMVMPPSQPTPAKIAAQEMRMKAMDARRRMEATLPGWQPVLNDPLGRAIAAATPLIGGPNHGPRPVFGGSAAPVGYGLVSAPQSPFNDADLWTTGNQSYLDKYRGW